MYTHFGTADDETQHSGKTTDALAAGRVLKETALREAAMMVRAG